MTYFKKLNTKIYQKSGPVITPDYIYWKKLGAPVLVKEFGPIDYIDFSPIEPYHFAVTCSVRVQVYNPITKFVVKNLSRFRQSAYGAVFRDDGKLLCSGGEEAVVKLFDVASKSLLRLFKGHTAPVHRTHFIPDRPHIASFSDDKTVRIWDIATESTIVTHEGHTDYVRAGAVSPILPDIVLSGGYDGKVFFHDSRANSEVLSVDHGSPVESVLFLPSGGIFLSAGGTDVKVWDALSGGRLLAILSNHHKTVTCMRLGSENRRLLTSSLDRHVKIYDISTFEVVHTLDYPNAVLSLGVSKNDDVVAGLVDGLVSISRKVDEDVSKPEKRMSHNYIPQKHVEADVVVPVRSTEQCSKYDVCLRKFQYSKALIEVLRPYVAKKSPEITVGLLQELARRKAQSRVFKNMEEKHLIQLLRFFVKNITDYRFTKIIINAVDVFMNVYEHEMDTLPADAALQIVRLNQLVEQEVCLHEQLAELQGAMQMLLAASNAANDYVAEKVAPHNLQPSEDAQKNFVINIT